MKKITCIILMTVLSSCLHSNPPSEAATAAGMLSHAKVHEEKRAAGQAYTASEEYTAQSTGNFTASRWDAYQSGNKVATIQQAQATLNASHAKINASFPAGKKPFVIGSAKKIKK